MPTEEELAAQAAATSQADEQASSDNKEASELERARREAANYRTKLREAEAKLKEAEPVLTEYQKLQESQKTEAQKQAERIAELEKQAADANASAQAAQREAKLTILAGKAKVDPELLPLIDISKINLDDEAEALKALGKFATVRQQSNSASNPGRSGEQGKSDAELRDEIFGKRRTSSIFGG